ncbi:MAG: response regulator transcription factor [Eubacteriales bacterium]|nr:response regulator transcription factor [Eubacteriales bacterium]
MKLLLAEDDRDMARGVSTLLTRSGYTVDTVYNGNDALIYLRNGDYNGAVLDIMMPGLSGLEVLTAVRREGMTVPILLLTAMGEVEDRIEGLESGADDYLPKPFDGGELIARVRAMLRRTENYTPDIVSAGDLKLDRNSSKLSCGKKSTVLNNKSFQVMEMLILNTGRIISVNEFMTHIWGWDSEAEVNVVWVNISSLRRQMEKIGSRMQIRSIRNAGYVLESSGD